MADDLIKIFLSYSHQDELFKDELVKHLIILQRHRVISSWQDRMILPGREWDREINQHLNTSDIILLLVSADFIASDYCWGVEVETAMKRHETGEARVIPVILRPVGWTRASFGKLQALPKNAKPIELWTSRDSAFDDVATGIERVVNELRQARSQKTAASTYYDLGMKWFEQQKFEEAITEYRRAIEIDPNYALAYNSLGNALAEQGQVEEAITAYYRAIQLNSSFARPYNNLGLALIEQGKVEEAIAAYRQAIRLDPSLALPHNNLGIVLHNQNRIEEAISEYRSAIQLDPNFARPYNNIGIILGNQGKIEEAIAQYRRAIQLDPNFVIAYRNLASTLLDQGNTVEAINTYHRVIELDPYSSSDHNNLGNALGQQGNTTEAITAYHRAIQLDPENAYPHNGLGVTFSNLGREQEAIVAYRQAILIDPNFVLPHKNVASLLYYQDRFEEAAATYRRILQITPNDTDTHKNLEITLHKIEERKDEKAGLFNRFTEKAIKVVMLAQEESRRIQRNSVGTDQLLLGLIAEGTGMAAIILQSMRVNLKDARIEAIKLTGYGSEQVANEIPFTPRAKLGLEQSLNEANLLGHNYIGTEHLLLGLISADESGCAARILENLGIDLQQVRKQVYTQLRQLNIRN